MATYVTSIKFTQQGIKNFGDTTRRAAAFKESAAGHGVTVKEMYWTLGDQDGLILLDAPDDASVTAALLQLGALGNVQTTTQRAFTASEMDAIAAKS